MTKMMNAHGLLVGIANYRTISSLPSAVRNDVQEIYNALVDADLCAYSPANVQLLLDDEATQSRLRQAFSALQRGSDRNSTVFIYISCHGGRIEDGPDAGVYLLPVDARLDSTASATRLVASTALSGVEVTQYGLAKSDRL